MAEVTAPVETPIYDEEGVMDEAWWIFLTSLGTIASESDKTFDSITLDDLTPNRLTASDSDKKIVSVENLTAWIAGTSLELEVTDNLDGTVTLGLPDNVTITADLTVQNDLIVANDATIQNDLTVDNDVSVGNDLAVANDATVENDLTVNGDTFIKADKKLYFDNS